MIYFLLCVCVCVCVFVCVCVCVCVCVLDADFVLDNTLHPFTPLIPNPEFTSFFFYWNMTALMTSFLFIDLSPGCLAEACRAVLHPSVHVFVHRWVHGMSRNGRWDHQSPSGEGGEVSLFDILFLLFVLFCLKMFCFNSHRQRLDVKKLSVM